MHIFKDESFRNRPIGTALDYTWAALSANWKNSAIVAAILLLLMLFQIIPILGIVAGVLQSIIFYALAYWAVENIIKSSNIENFKEQIQNANVKDMLFSFLAPASGFYLGFIIISVIFIAATALIFWLTGGGAIFSMMQEQMGNSSMAPEQAMIFYTQILGMGTPAILFFIIAITFFGYIWPLVYGYALMQRSFSDALNALFMLFSTRFWRAAFTMKYLKIVSLWMLILFGAMIVAGICASLFILIPVAVLILLWLTYFSAIVSAEVYNLYDDI
ncbi:MAG: hypothetical protein L3J42_01795 [Hydrogenimonas sp.]|nr:hypothetical protein [Hydrogenimonas sp.]